VTAVLVIAATDSSGGAGLTRDAQVLAHFGCEVLCAVTAVTAQTDAGVAAIHVLPPHLVSAQINAAFAGRRVGAIKIGMLGNAATVQAVVQVLPPRGTVPLILDPVLASSSGTALLDEPGREALRSELLPRTSLLTPNIAEAAQLLGEEPARTLADMQRQARALLDLGPSAILLKGGHACGDAAVDVLVYADDVRSFSTPRLARTHRGTGCALASAIAAGIAQGQLLVPACEQGKRYVTQMLSKEQSAP
jgi:hydroxymethylpyrimidine/phosphomethylpyrimidine kinase